MYYRSKEFVQLPIMTDNYTLWFLENHDRKWHDTWYHIMDPVVADGVMCLYYARVQWNFYTIYLYSHTTESDKQTL